MKNHANLIREFIDEVLNHGNIEATGESFHEDVASWLACLVKDRDLMV
jgi:hypothetical protein